MSSSRYIPIKELTTWTPRWIICGRVTEKAPINSFKRSDGNAGKVGSVDIMDRNGDSIRAKFWGDAADKWMTFLEHGQIYTFSGGRVQVANKRYSNLQHDYELTFDVSASIQKFVSKDLENNSSVDVSIPHLRKYNFMSLRDIHDTTREPPFLVDLLVILKWFSPSLDQFVNRNTQDAGIRRLCTVADDSGYEMSLTLFGDHTAIDKQFPDHYNLQHDVIILAVQNVQIRRFRGLNGSTLRSSHITVSPDIPEALKLKEWLSSEQGQRREWKSLSEGDMNNSRIGEQNGEINTIKSLSDVALQIPLLPLQLTPATVSQGTTDPQELSTVIVEPSRLLYTNRGGEVALSYPACRQCNRKIIKNHQNDCYRCEICNLEIPEPSYRYMFAMHLVDHSAGRFLVRTFHDPGAVILKRSANELSESISYNMKTTQLPENIRETLEYDALWKKYRMRIRARREMFADTERVTIGVIYAEPLNLTTHARRLINEINTLLPTSNTTSLGEVVNRKRQPSMTISEAKPNNDEDRENLSPLSTNFVNDSSNNVSMERNIKRRKLKNTLYEDDPLIDQQEETDDKLIN